MKVITTDRGMEYEQNLGMLPIAVVILRGRSNTIEDIRPLLPELLDALQHLAPRSLISVPRMKTGQRAA